MKILLVDDHALFREGVEALLLRLDPAIVVVHAAHCQAAFAYVEKDEPLDVILLDLGLPDMPGREALARLRERRPEVPVVVLSGSDDRDTVLDALDRGAMGFIPKSSTGDVLLHALRLVLAKSVYIPQSAIQKIDPDVMPNDVAYAPIAATEPAEIELTARETEVLACIVQGFPNKLIARTLGMEVSTVKAHVTEVLRALDVTNRTQAVVAVARLGLTFAKRESEHR